MWDLLIVGFARCGIFRVRGAVFQGPHLRESWYVGDAMSGSQGRESEAVVFVLSESLKSTSSVCQ